MNPILTALHILGNIPAALNQYGANQMAGVQGYRDTINLPLAQKLAARNADPRIQAMINQNLIGIAGQAGNGTKYIRVGDKLIDASTLSEDALAKRQFGLNLARSKQAPLIEINPRQMIRDALAEAVK